MKIQLNVYLQLDIRQQIPLSLYANLSCNIVNKSSLTFNICFAFIAIKYSSVLRNAKKLHSINLYD